MKFKAFIFTALLSLACVAVNAEDKNAKKPNGKLPKFEEAVSRGFARARLIDDLKLVRTTMITQDLLDETKLVIFFEFGTGDLAMFQGGMEVSEDSWVFVDKKNLELLEEVVKRGSRR